MSDSFRNIPDELKERDQWLMWDQSNDTPKQPHWRGDFAISWSKPHDWHSFDEAVEAAEERESWGIGYVMAQDNGNCARGLYSCLDLDGCLESRSSPKDWLPSLEQFIDNDAYIEYSPSGDGLHIPLVGQDIPEWWTDSHLSDEEHEGVDVLTNKFCTFTGDVLDSHEPSGVSDVDPTPWLHDAFYALNGEYPRTEAEEDEKSDYADEDWTKEQIEGALNALNSNCAYPKWRNIAFAVHDWDSGTTGKSLFEAWSRGEGWDGQSQRYIDQIWSNSDPDGGVSVGTLIHHAMEAGWQPSGVSVQTDGGAAATGGGSQSSGASGGPPSWSEIRGEYQAAEDTDEKSQIRYTATDTLLEEYDFVNVRESDELYVYDEDNGIFRDRGDRELREAVREGLQGHFRRSEKNEMAEHVRAVTTEPYNQLGGPERHIPVKNGVVKLDGTNRQLLDHSPEYRFLHRAGTEFDETADCPTWKAFLKDSIRSGAERDKLQEYVGYALHHWGLPFHKGLFLVGPKASGKSTFLDTVRSLLGEEGIASVTPQQMTERFGGAELFGKWANIRSDIPSEMISNTGAFKEILAGDAIKAEKKHQDPFMFKPRSKHFYSANTLPDTEDDDDAFYRRILLVAFPTSVPPEQQDKRLPETLKDELPGILNWALDGLQRLLDQRGFTGDRDEAKTADTWTKWGSTTDRFASICLNAGGGETIPKGDVYNVYSKFCQQENMPAEPQRVFTRRLKTEHGIQDGKTSVDGRQQRCFMDIAFTHRAEEYQDLDDDRGGMNSGLGNY